MSFRTTNTRFTDFKHQLELVVPHGGDNNFNG